MNRAQSRGAGYVLGALLGGAVLGFGLALSQPARCEDCLTGASCNFSSDCPGLGCECLNEAFGRPGTCARMPDTETPQSPPEPEDPKRIPPFVGPPECGDPKPGTTPDPRCEV